MTDASTMDEATKVPPPKQGRSEPALAWMKRHAVIAVEENVTYPLVEYEVGGMSDLMRDYLHSVGMHAIFSIQKAVWEMTCGGMSTLHDLCFSAPTGSGKTLAYALPIVNALYKRQEKGCLRCVVVLPTRGLALQVYSVIQPLGRALGLESVAICGTVPVSEEAEILMHENGLGCDIAIFTPGRLVSHIESTHGFANKLENAAFLVIDEADRLLRQRYNDWISKMLGRNTKAAHRLVKFVVSATLTRDPSKLEALQLQAPRFVTFVQEDNKYKLPSTLKESKVVVADSDKPAALCTLLLKNLGGCIVFVSSVEAASTLVRLLHTVEKKANVSLGGDCRHDDGDPRILEYSAAMTPKEREHTLTEFKEKRCRILVCSDAITRGIDIPGVDTVLNYDTPVYAKTYVHRAGRTARAGKKGSVITILKKEDVRHFKDMLRKADNNYVTNESLDSDVLRTARTWVTDALAEMASTRQPQQNSAAVPQTQRRKRRKKTSYPQFMPEAPEINTLNTIAPVVL